MSDSKEECSKEEIERRDNALESMDETGKDEADTVNCSHTSSHEEAGWEEEEDRKPPAIDRTEMHSQDSTTNSLESLQGAAETSRATESSNDGTNDDRSTQPAHQSAQTSESAELPKIDTESGSTDTTSNPQSSPAPIHTEVAAAATPPRNTRAQRLARKRDQLNEQATSPSRPRPGPTGSPSSPGSRLPPIIAPQPVPSSPQRSVPSHALPGDDLVRTSPVARLPGDDLVANSCACPQASRPAITSRARQPITQPASNGTASASGPIPYGPRVTRKMQEIATINNNATNNTVATTAAPPTTEDPRPGAYRERNIAIGDLPVWARDGAVTAGTHAASVITRATTTASQEQATTATDAAPEESAPGDSSLSNHNSPEEAQRLVSELGVNGPSTALNDIENSGLASAEPVTDAETVVYAEDVKEDEMVWARRKFLMLGAIAFVTIVGLVLTLVLVLVDDKGDDECNRPMEEQSISMYCRCQNTADGYLKYFYSTDESLYKRYESVKTMAIAKSWVNASAVDISEASCEVENLAFTSMAMISRKVGIEDFEKEGFGELSEVLSQQQFALHVLYFSLNGDYWNRNDDWLKDAYVCNWHGLHCDFPSRVSAIELGQNNVSGTLPNYIGLAQSLKRLDLSRNPIHGTIPSTELVHLNLREIDVSSAQLTGTIPSEVAVMTSLHMLDLANNSLTGTLPSEMRTMRLFTLRLDINNLRGTLPALGQGDHYNRRLQFLSVRHNQLQGTVPSETRALPRLEYVDLSYNNFKGAPPDFVSASPEIVVVNLIESGFKGYLPDAYCQEKTTALVLAVCRGDSDIQECECCEHNSSHLLQCKSDLERPVLQYVTGPDPLD